MTKAFKDPYLDDEECHILTVVAFGRRFIFEYSKSLDDIDVIGVDHDGEVFVASCGQVPVYDSGAWYMGDEKVQAGLINIEQSEAPNLMTYLEYVDGVYLAASMPEDFTPTLREV